MSEVDMIVQGLITARKEARRLEKEWENENNSSAEFDDIMINMSATSHLIVNLLDKLEALYENNTPRGR